MTFSAKRGFLWYFTRTAPKTHAPPRGTRGHFMLKDESRDGSGERTVFRDYACLYRETDLMVLSATADADTA